jgi:nucleoside-diphosphate-sugar epimerase
VYCSGTGSIGIPTPDGEWREETYAEDDAVVPYLWTAKRLGTEQLTLNGACRGVRAMVVRPPMVWGLGGSKQIPSIFYSVRQTGNACYVGKGLNMYSHVHVDDLAELFCLVVDRGTAGHLYHAVAGEVNWRTIAEAVAEVRECHARSVTLSEAQVIWGRVEANIVFATSSRSRAVRSRRELGWQPSRTDLIDDIRHGSYREAFGGADSRRFRELEMYSVSDPKSQG